MKRLSPERFAELRRLFDSLLDAPPPQREARLAAIAAQQPELAPLLKRLLDQAQEPDEDEDDATPARAAPAAGEIVGGRYRLVRLIGEGGMGDVYLAERSDDIAQKVALKLLRGRSAGVIGRFVRERQILARLGHPHIAHLVDGGVGDDGTLWFAMEYVDGRAITDACDARRLDSRARAALLVQVCRAVQFAHGNLVLHRDLKPSNILVDAGGAPKLLDFGIARLLDDTDAERSHTVTMTPAYAPPEQLRGDPLTTASDVYQLGLVLHELFAGVPARDLRRRGAAGAVAAMPSLDQAYARLGADAAARIAHERATTSARLRRTLRGDLQRIAAKAIADDPRERYESAQELGDDLQRWASGMPVRARRASFAYRLRKLLRRHAAAASLVALLGLGLVASSVFALNRAWHERRQRERAQTVLAFMRDVVRQSDPQYADGADLSPADLFERAGAGLDRRADIDALTRGALSNEIASVLLSRGRYEAARASAQRAVAALEAERENQPAEYLEALTTWLQALSESGIYDAQIAAVDRSLDLARRAGGSWYAQLLRLRGWAKASSGRVGEGEADLRAAIEQFQRVDAADPGLHSALNDLANLASQRGDLRSALDLYRRALAALDVADAAAASGPSKFNRLVVQLNLATAHQRLGESRAAIDVLEPLVAQAESLLGTAHDRTVGMRNLLIQAHASVGELARAQALLEVNRRLRDEAASMQPATRAEIGVVGAKIDLYALHAERALPVLRDASAAQHAGAPAPSLHRARVDSLLGEALLQQGDCAQALPLLDRAGAEAAQASAGRPNSAAAEIEDSRGRCLLASGDAAAAIAHFDRAIALFGTLHGDAAPSTLRSRVHRLWAETAAGGDAASLQGFAALRAALVDRLGGEDVVQIWQLDLLFDRLAQERGALGADPARRERAESGLARVAQAARPPRFVGLSGFS